VSLRSAKRETIERNTEKIKHRKMPEDIRSPTGPPSIGLVRVREANLKARVSAGVM